MTQFSVQVRPSSRDTAWYQRHERGVIWSQHPRTMIGVPPSSSSPSQVPTPSTKLPQAGGGVEHSAFRVDPVVGPQPALDVEQTQAHAAEAARGYAQFLDAGDSAQDREHRRLARELPKPPSFGRRLWIVHSPVRKSKSPGLPVAVGARAAASALPRAERSGGGESGRELQQVAALQVGRCVVVHGRIPRG